MTIEKLKKFLEEKIKKCEENEEVYKEHEHITLWTQEHYRKLGLMDVLKSIEG